MWPIISLLGIYLKEKLASKDTCTSMFTAQHYSHSQVMESAYMSSTSEGIKEMWTIYTMESYSAIRKNIIMKQCNKGS